MTGWDRALNEAAEILAVIRAEHDDRDPAAAAEAAFVPGGPSVAEIESRIRRRRGLPERAAS